MKEYQEPQPH